MKILHIIYDSPNNPWLGGGGAVRTHELYRRLATKHDITVLCGKFSEEKYELVDGVRYQYVGLPSSYAVSRLSFFILAFFRILFARRYDVYIEDISFPGPLLSTILKKRHYASVQYVPNASLVKKRGLIGRLVQSYFVKGLRGYRQIICVSQYVSEKVKESGAQGNISVVSNGINLPVMPEKNGGDYFLYIGRIDIHGKGLDVLMPALVEAQKTHPEMRLVVAGGGEPGEINSLKKIVEDLNLAGSVEFAGVVNGDIKDRMIRNAYALVAPSRNESFSITTLEAYSYGKPAIGSRVGGLTHLIESCPAGFGFESEDIDGLAQRMVEVWEARSRLPQLSLAARQYAEKYTWDRIAQEFEEVIQR